MPDAQKLAKELSGRRAFPMPQLLPTTDVLIDYLALDYGYDRPSFEVAVRAGLEQWEKKNYEKCAEYLGVAYEISRRLSQVYLPMAQGALFLRSMAHSALGKNVEALQDIDVALQVLPYAPSSLFWRGFLLLKSGDRIEAAYKSLQQLVAVNPEWRNLTELILAFFLQLHGFQEKGILMCTRVIRRIDQEFGSLDHEFERLSKENEERKRKEEADKKTTRVVAGDTSAATTSGSKSEQAGGSASSSSSSGPAAGDPKAKAAEPSRQGNSSAKEAAPAGIVKGSEQVGGSESSTAYKSYETREEKRARQNVDMLRALAYFLRGESYKGHAHGAYFAQQAADDFSVVLDVGAATFGRHLGKGLSADKMDTIIRDCKLLDAHLPKPNAVNYPFYALQARGQRPFSIFGRVIQFGLRLKSTVLARKHAAIKAAANSPSARKQRKAGAAGGGAGDGSVSPGGGGGSVSPGGRNKKDRRKEANAKRIALAQKLASIGDAAKPLEFWGPVDSRATHVTPYRRQWVLPGDDLRTTASRSMTNLGGMSKASTNATTAALLSSKETRASSSSRAGSQSPTKNGWYRKSADEVVVPTPYELKFQARSSSPDEVKVKRARERSRSASLARRASREASGKRLTPRKPVRAKAPAETGKNPEIYMANVADKKGSLLGADDGGGEPGKPMKNSFMYTPGIKLGWTQSIVDVAKTGPDLLDPNAVSASVINILGLKISSAAQVDDDMGAQEPPPTTPPAEEYGGSSSSSRPRAEIAAAAAPPEPAEAAADAPVAVAEGTASTVGLGDVVGTETLRAAAEFAQLAAEADAGPSAEPSSSSKTPPADRPDVATPPAVPVPEKVGVKPPEKSASPTSAADKPEQESVAPKTERVAPPKKPKRTLTQAQYINADPTVLASFGLRDMEGGEVDDVIKAHERPFHKEPAEAAVKAALSRPSTDKPLPPKTKFEDWAAEALRMAEYYYRSELAERGEASPSRSILDDEDWETKKAKLYQREDICKHLRNLATWKKKDVIDAVYDGKFEEIGADYNLDSVLELTNMANVDNTSYCQHFLAH